MIIIAVAGYSGSGKSTVCKHLCERHGFREASFAAPMKEMVKIAFDFSAEQLYGPSEMRNAPDKRYPLSSCPWCGASILFNVDDRGRLTGERICNSDAPHRNLPEFLTPRIALQTLGTEWARRLYPNVWAEACIRRMRAEEDQYVAEAVRALYRGVPFGSDPPRDLEERTATQARRDARFCISDLRFRNELEVVHAAGGKTLRVNRGEKKFDHASENAIASLPVHAEIWNDGSLETLYENVDHLLRTEKWL